MSLSTVILALLAIIQTSAAADRCGSSAKAISPFDIDEYLGIWYQIAVNKVFEELFERRYPLCVYANYTKKGNDSVKVLNTGFNSDGDNNIAEGTAVQKTANTADLEVSFYGFPGGPYDIIKMINDKHGKYSIALVWSCSKLGFTQNLWLLSREREISDKHYKEMMDYAVSTGINVDKLKIQNTSQTHCSFE